MAQYALAADLGGTQLRVALVDRDGNVTRRNAIPTLAQQGRDDVMERFVAALQQTASAVERASLVGIGVSQAGPTNSDTGMMYNPPNLPGWDGFSPNPTLEERLSLTSSRVALVDRDGNVTRRNAIPTLAQQGRDDVMERFVAALQQMASAVERASLVGIGVSQAGPTNSDT